MSDPKKLEPEFNVYDLILLYIQLTYCYEVFDSIPRLWLCMPQNGNFFGVEELPDSSLNCVEPHLGEKQGCRWSLCPTWGLAESYS